MALPTGINVSGTAAPAAGERREPAPSQDREASTLSVFKSELVPITVRTPEKLAEKVELSAQSVDTLARTVASHLGVVEKIRRSQVPPPIDVSTIGALTDLHKNLYAVFKQMYPGVDLSKLDFNKPEDLEALVGHARTLVGRGGAEVRLAYKLLQWEEATLQMASGRMFIPEGKIEYKKEIGEELVLVMTEDGAVETTKAGSWLERTFKGKKVIKRVKYKIGGATKENRMELDTNTLLSSQQRKFLTESGWVTGDLDAEQIKTIDKRLSSIVAVGTELFVKTGVDLSTITPNLIKKDTGLESFSGRNYNDRITAYFIGEARATGTDLIQKLEAQGVEIATEVKTKVQAELKKKQEERREQRAQAEIPERLQAKIDELQTRSRTQIEIDAVKSRIDAEIKALNDELTLFIRRDQLLGGYATAEQVVRDAENALNQRAAQLGRSSTDLIAWSDDISNDQSLRYFQAQLKRLNVYYNELKAQLDQDRQYLAELNKLMRDEETTDATTGKPLTRTPRQEVIKEYNDTRDAVNDDKNKLYNNPFTADPSIPNKNKQSLQALVTEKTLLVEERKSIIEDDATTKGLLDKYWEAKRALEKLTSEQTDTTTKLTAVETKYSASAATRTGKAQAAITSDDIRAEINFQIKAKEKDKTEVSGLSTADKTEVTVLTAIRAAYADDSIRQGREDRIAAAEKTAQGLDAYELTRSPIWNEYPEAVMRAVQLIWGDEVVMGMASKKDQIAQVQTLLKSGKYLSVFITRLNSLIPGILIHDSTYAGAPANLNPDGTYKDITKVFRPLADVNRDLSYVKVNKKIIDEIMRVMVERALGTTTAPLP